MRTSESALRVLEEPELAPVTQTSTDAPADDPPSVWERVATVTTILVGVQLALLALLGL
jgi:hypothetical protein